MAGVSPSRLPVTEGRIFYGWTIVIVGALIVFSSGPGQSYTFAIFIDSMIDDTGISRSTISGLFMLSTGLGAVMVATVSRLADRIGIRITVIVVGIAFAGACFSMAFATGVIAFYLSYAGLRALGQGGITINATLLVNQWFVMRRGRAIALMGLGSPLSSAILPPMSRFMIDQFGWRQAYAALGVMVLLLVVPPVLMFVRNRPEDTGLYPDGLSKPPEAEQTLPVSEDGSDQRRVLSSLSFWLLALPLATPALVLTALIFHQTSIFEERGLSAAVAAGVFVVFSIGMASTSLITGFVIERTGPTRLIIFSMLTLLSALVMSMLVTSLWIAIAYVFTMGVTVGVGQIVQGVTWAHYYGRFGLGRVQGSAMMVTFTGSAIGPFPLALFHDLTGNYDLGIMAMMVLPVISIIAIILARPERTLEQNQFPDSGKIA